MNETWGPTDPVVYIGPGEVYASEAPACVVTVLGSCVALVLHSAQHRFGAICHAALPTGQPGDFRHVDYSVRWLCDWFRDRGIAPRTLTGKLFGGANMFAQVVSPLAGRQTVGQQNVARARAACQAEGVRIVASELGGTTGRKLYFYTAGGEVYVRRTSAGAVEVPQVRPVPE